MIEVACRYCSTKVHWHPTLGGFTLPLETHTVDDGPRYTLQKRGPTLYAIPVRNGEPGHPPHWATCQLDMGHSWREGARIC